MQKLLLTALAATLSLSAYSQITITANDMPVVNDTLRWSAAAALPAGMTTATTGANTTWDFSSLTAMLQGVDDYKTAASVNVAYGIIISPTAYGYKVADSIPGLAAQLPISVSDLYTFFNKKTSPSRFIAEGFGAIIATFPTPAVYSDEDEIYLFPLTYPYTTTNTTFKLKGNVAGLGTFGQQGTRKTEVDGWGTIMTPYTTTPVQVIRVRSELVEIDSISSTTLGINVGIPRTTVEYKWLANGQHYPMMYVTANKTGGTETVTAVRYRDSKRSLAVQNAPSRHGISALTVYPSPATSGTVNIEIPAGIGTYTVELFDISGKLVQHSANTASLNVSTLQPGQYIIRVSAASWTGIGKVTK